MSLRAPLAACLLALGVSAFAAAPAPAPAGVHVEHAWIRWLPANLPVAGYAVIVNDSDATLHLTGASTPAYGMVMLHYSRLAHSDSTMQRVDYLDVPAHGRATLAPGAYHLMLSGATRAIKPGDTVPVTLEFAGGESIQVDFPVLPANSTGPSD